MSLTEYARPSWKVNKKVDVDDTSRLQSTSILQPAQLLQQEAISDLDCELTDGNGLPCQAALSAYSLELGSFSTSAEGRSKQEAKRAAAGTMISEMFIREE